MGTPIISEQTKQTAHRVRVSAMKQKEQGWRTERLGVHWMVREKIPQVE